MVLFSALGFLIPAVLVGLIVLGILALAGGRGEPDPTGRRTYALYLVAASFVALFVTLFAATAMVSSIVRIALPDRENQDCVEFEGGISCGGTFGPVPGGVDGASQSYAPLRRFDPDRGHTRDAVQSGLVAVAAALVLWFHARRALALVHEPDFASSPALRTYRAYLYSVCFVAILVVLFASVAAVYGLIRIVAPGTTGPGFGGSSAERDQGIAQLVTGGLLAAAAYAVFAFHWRRADDLRTEKAAEPAQP
jgi:hypothetical protein